MAIGGRYRAILGVGDFVQVGSFIRIYQADLSSSAV